MKVQTVVSNKIFGIGLSRTGTASLNEALNYLGIKTIHYPIDYKTYIEISGGHFRLSVLEQYDGITDIVCSPYFSQLDREYPGSKFILTLRSQQAWLNSMETHWKNRDTYLKQMENSKIAGIVNYYRIANYGTSSFSKIKLADAFERHHKKVFKYFRGSRSSRLLNLNIFDGEGWEKLAAFLDKPVPKLDFPNVNQG